MPRRSMALALAGALACAGKGPPAALDAGSASAAHADRSRIPEKEPPPELRVPRQRHFQLANGLKVRLVEYRRLPIVALNLVLDAGAAHDPEELPGLASFTASMVTEGTKLRSATRISDELGFIGAHLSAGAGFDSVSVSGAALSRHLGKLLDLLGDVVANPAFPPQDFARVQDQRLVALVQQRDSPGAVASKAFSALFWRGTPYGHWPMGTEASVKAITREDLARFHQARWRPGSAELVVVGDVSEGELRAMVDRALGAWSGGGLAQPLGPAAGSGQRGAVLVEKPGAPQSFVIMGMPGLPRSSPDYVAAEVAFQVLGGGGMSSRLMRNLREKRGYTYGVYARAEARKLGGTSVIAGSIKAEVTGAALRELFGEIEKLRDSPVPDGELEDAKSSLVLSLPSEFAAAGGIASKLAEEVVYGLPDDYWDRYAAELQKVTAADVKRVARKYLDASRLTIVMVTEPAVVKPQLDGLPLGAVEVRPAPAAAEPR